MTLLCTDTLVSYASRVGVAGPRIWSPRLVVPGQDVSGPRDFGIRARWINYGVFRQPKFECGCCEILVLRFVERDRTYVLNFFLQLWPR